MFNVITSVTLHRCFMTHLILCFYFVCALKRVCSGILTLEHTHTRLNEWIIIWDHQVLSHPTHVQYPGYAHSLTGKKKTHESCISKRCTAISFMSCEFVNWKPYLGSEGKNETVSGWHCACELASDGVHTARYAVLSFFFWILFFHTVPSLQQNIHIKTLADDMVRCSV